MATPVRIAVGLMVVVLALCAAAFSEERAAPRDATPYTGPKRPFDPRPLMDKLRADPSRQTGPFTFVCVSDREFGLKEFNEVARQAEKTGFDFCVLPGDMVHRGAGPQGIQDYDDLERESGWFLARHPCWPVLGNHEIGKNSGAKDRRPDTDGFERWKAFYNMPDDWYSFTYRNNLFIVIGLISDLTAERQRERVEVYPGKHMAWLEQQLKAGQGMDNGRSGGYRLHNPARGADKTYKTAPYFFIALTVEGKKVTARAVITGGEEIDSAVLRDTQGRNVGPEVEKTTTPVRVKEQQKE